MFGAKARWWPEADFERIHIKPQQNERYEADPWEEAVRDYIILRTKVTVTEVARAIGIETTEISKAEQNRITATLLDLGWRRGKRGGPQGVRFWERGD